MAYAFERGEPVRDGVARIMDEQLVRARESLADSALSLEKRVHEARKRFKETRALIRLVREPLGKHFREEDRWFRDAGRELASARDADAVREAARKLELPRAVARKVQRALDRARVEATPLDALIENAGSQLVIAQSRVALWPLMKDSFETLAPGLHRTYRDGRRDLRRHETPEELHDWRKRVKEHWYHVLLLRNTWPEMMKPYAEVLSSLSRSLGDHHDLHVLRETLAGAVPEAVPFLDRRQVALEEQASAMGSRLYAEKPSSWLARMRNLWNAWTTRP